MYRYKNLMVGLNYNDHDKALIRYAGLISRLAESERVYFFHAVDNFSIPDEIQEKYPEVVQAIDDSLKSRMERVVQEQFDGYNGTEKQFVILEGSPLKELLRWSKEKDIDLLILGRSLDAQIGGHLAEKLARKAFCSVLILPHGSDSKIDRILIPIDFSEHSLNALDVGTAFARALGLTNLQLVYAYNVPQGFYKTGKTFEAFAEIMLKNAQTSYGKFLSDADLKGVAIDPHFVMNEDAIEAVQTMAEEQNTSLVVVGARGRSSSIAAILLGSVTEGLIRRLKRPILAVKKKGAGLNLLEAAYF